MSVTPVVLGAVCLAFIQSHGLIAVPSKVGSPTPREDPKASSGTLTLIDNATKLPRPGIVRVDITVELAFNLVRPSRSNCALVIGAGTQRCTRLPYRRRHPLALDQKWRDEGPYHSG